MRRSRRSRIDLRCYAAAADDFAAEGAFKASCMALGNATQLLDGHLDDDSDSDSGSGGQCVRVRACEPDDDSDD